MTLPPVPGGARTRRRSPWRRLLAGQGGLLLLVLLAGFALAAFPLGAALGPDAGQADLLARFEPPSARHWLGTDEAGRDELLRLMQGGQTSLLVGLIGAAGGALIGLGLGVPAGYLGGWTDALLMRFTDAVMALPLLPLLIVIGAVDPVRLGIPPGFAHSVSGGVWRISVIVVLVDWTQIARLARAATAALRGREHLRAARALGAPASAIMRRHVLPGIAGPVTVAIALAGGRVILFESVLSFLGLGIPPPAASWGNMLTDAQELLTTAPLLALYPGLLIFTAVLAANLLGAQLRRAFDPLGGAF